MSNVLNSADRTSSGCDAPSETSPLMEDHGAESGEGDGETKEHVSGPSNGGAQDLLPPEIWTEVCRKLQHLDRAEAIHLHETNTSFYPELAVRMRDWDIPVCTSRSLIPLTTTCRFLHGISIPLLLEAVRVSPQHRGPRKGLGDFAILRQLMALGRLPNGRLQHVKDLAVELPFNMEQSVREELLLNRLDSILAQLQRLRHLTLIRISLNEALMQRITALPLRALCMLKSSPSPTIVDSMAYTPTGPQINLRSLVLGVRTSTLVNDAVRQWFDRLATGTLEDMLLDVALLPPKTSTLLEHLRSLTLRGLPKDPDILGKLSTFFSRAPKLEYLSMCLDAPTAPSLTGVLIPPTVSRIELHSSWIPYLVLGTSTTRIMALIQPETMAEQIIRFVSQSAKSVQYLSLQYDHKYPEGAWTGDDLRELVRLFPDLMHFRFRLEDPMEHNFRGSLQLVSKLRSLRSVSFGLPSGREEFGISWQEPALAQLVGDAKSSKLYKVSFVRGTHWEHSQGKWKFRVNGSTVATRCFDSKLATAYVDASVDLQY